MNTTLATAVNVMSWEVQEEEIRESRDADLRVTGEAGRLTLRSTEVRTLQYPGVHELNHWYTFGFVSRNDYTIDLSGWYGLEISLRLPQDEPYLLKLEIGQLLNKSPLPEEVEYTAYQSLIAESGEHRLLIPFKLFDDLKALSSKWRFVRSLRLSGEWLSGDQEREVDIIAVQFKRRKGLFMHAPVLSRAAEAGSRAEYEISLTNCSAVRQAVRLSQEYFGWEIMHAVLRPDSLFLKPGETGTVQMTVDMPERVAPGGFEKQIIHAVPNGAGDEGERLEFTTLRKLPHPYVQMVESEWEGVRRKVAQYPRMEELLGVYTRRADDWVVPEINTNPDDPYMFETHHSHLAHNAIIAWKVSGRAEFAEKAALFLKRVINPVNGYATNMRACHQALVHEGEFFKHMAVVYDLLHDTDYLTEEDHKNTEICFRLFIELIDWTLGFGDISNWSTAEIAGALYCSQALQDRERMDRFIYGIGGITEQLARGTLDDGWWYECAVGYNLMGAGLFTEFSQSLKPWGINLKDIWVPASYYPQVTPGGKKWIDGLSMDIWGPSTKNYRSIPMLWDSLLPYVDYRGVMFGVNDAAESLMPGISPRGYMDARFDLAHYLFGNPDYADVLRDSPLAERDLLFAAGEPPESSSQLYLTSAYSDNAGVAVLRSQTGGREAREQIQVALKYGSHGGAHGHYDRASLLSVMRYGRSFYNPENIWYGYGTFMYKFYVQNSITHNMVTVDLKQQDPAEGSRLLFHTGKLFQAAAVENIAKWANPPYGGWTVKNDTTFAERTWNEGRYVPIPDDAPAYTSRSGFTEEVLQRRLALVTDDYIVLFDYMRGDEVHHYDNLFHAKGLMSLTADGSKHHIRHTEQLETNPLGSAQFITDCDWYEMTGPVRASFEMGFGPGFDNVGNRTEFNEDGPLKLDIHAVWPPVKEMIVGTDPESIPVEKQLYYTVEADGQELAAGHFGAWILGREEIDIPLTGRSELVLKVRVDEVLSEDDFIVKTLKTVFWGDPQLITADGIAIDLADLPLVYSNTDQGHGPGKDYEGGPVKIQARRYPHALPAQPADLAAEGRITVDLRGLDIVRFTAAIGGDYPIGDETYRRKLLSSRVTGTEARFVTVLEPFEEQAVILRTEARSADSLAVYLRDGRYQEITIGEFTNGGDSVYACVLEYDSDGTLIREEATSLQ